jgi:RNA polymerase sigma-70 factor (ECF subfamily)
MPPRAVPTRSDEPSTDELVRRVLAGDTQAFAHVVRRYERDVWKIVALMLRDHAATEGFVQQCFVRAYERLGTYELGRDFGLWLKAIARNLVRNELRRSTRENERISEYRNYLLAAHAEDGAADEEELRLQRALAACREGLPEASMRALALRYEDALSLEEVSAAIGRTIVATRRMLFRLRLVLRACVEKRMAVE